MNPRSFITPHSLHVHVYFTVIMMLSVPDANGQTGDAFEVLVDS